MKQETNNKMAAILAAAQQKAADKTVTNFSTPEPVKQPEPVKEYDNLQDMEKAVKDGKVISLLNMSNLVNAKKQVTILGQTVTEGSKLHTKLLEQVKQFNDLAANETNQPELSTMTSADLISTPPQATEQPKTGVKIVDYSVKAFAVIGETKPIKELLRSLGGRFNNFLTCGPGWIFSKTRLEAVKVSLSL